MMRPSKAAVAIILLLATAAFAQAAVEKTPGSLEGTWSAGGSLGLANQVGDGDFDAGPSLSGYVEYFPHRNFSWRAIVFHESMEDPRFRSLVPSNDVDITALTGNAAYTWNSERVLPYVTAGLGVYHYDPDFVNDDVEIGLNAGGGMNILLDRNRRVALRIEGLFHATSADVEPDTFFGASAGAQVRW